MNTVAISEAGMEDIPSFAPSLAPSAESTRDLANLDFLRAAAVGLVLIDHLMSTMRIRGLGNIGHFGVLLFFVHTALVLMLSMDRLGLSGSRLYTAFLVRRIFRIYPLSVLTILVVVAFRVPSTSWSGGYAWAGWPELFSNLFLIQNITHSGSVISVLWSLPFELQMYATLPLLYLLMRRFPSFRVAGLVWMAGVVVASLEWILRGNCDQEFLLTRYFPCFLAGVFAWRLMAARIRHIPGSLWILSLVVLVLGYRVIDAFRVYGPAWFGAMHGTFRNDRGIWWPPYMDLVNDWIFCGITALLVPHFVGITNRWLNAISKRIAQYSYGIYVSHVPILWLCFAKLHIASAAVSAALSILLTALVSIALYHWLEDPAIRFGKRLATQLTQINALAWTLP